MEVTSLCVYMTLPGRVLNVGSAVMGVDKMSVSIATIKCLYLIATVQYLKGNMNTSINQERIARGNPASYTGYQ